MKKLSLFLLSFLFLGAGCVNSPISPPSDFSSDAIDLEQRVLDDEDREEMVVEDESLDVSEDTTIVEEDESPNVTQEQSGEGETPSSQQEPETVRVTLVAKSWEFEPSTVRVKEGQRVDLQIVSLDVSHGFKLTAFGVDETLEPGKTVQTSFVADKKGSFPFFCDVYCGEGHGAMRGTLIVE